MKQNSALVEIASARLNLRRFTPDDLAELCRLFSDPAVTRHYDVNLGSMAEVEEYARAWLDRRLRAYADHGHALWAAELKMGGAFVGAVGLTEQTVEGRADTEIGYHLKSEHWERGLATEAAIACRDYGFARLQRSRLISLIAPGNHPSMAVARRVGMSRERDVTWRGRAFVLFSMASPR